MVGVVVVVVVVVVVSFGGRRWRTCWPRPRIVRFCWAPFRS